MNNVRVCVGPRGGRRELPTPCAACVAFASCRPGACSEFWGCESWVDDEGRRPLLDPPAWMSARTAEEVDASPDGRGPDPEDFEEVDRLDVEPEEAAPSFVGVVGQDPEAGGPVLVAYVDPPAPFEPEPLGERQGVLPMVDAGPLFAVVEVNATGRLVVKRGRP